MVELEDERIRLPAIAAGMGGKVGEQRLDSFSARAPLTNPRLVDVAACS
jgi:hypothetical protein